jgi:hypothetical protein
VWSTPTLTLPPVINRSVTVGGPGTLVLNGGSLATPAPPRGVEVRYVASGNLTEPRGGASSRLEAPQAAARPLSSSRLEYTPRLSGAFPFRVRTQLNGPTQQEKRLYLAYLHNLLQRMTGQDYRLPDLRGASDADIATWTRVLQRLLQQAGTSFDSYDDWSAAQIFGGGSAEYPRRVVTDRRQGVIMPLAVLERMAGAVQVPDPRTGTALIVPKVAINGKLYLHYFEPRKYVPNDYGASPEAGSLVDKSVFAAMGGQGTNPLSAYHLRTIFPGSYGINQILSYYATRQEADDSARLATGFETAVRFGPFLLGPLGGWAGMIANGLGVGMNFMLDASSGHWLDAASGAAWAVLCFAPAGRGVLNALRMAAAGVVFADGGHLLYTGLRDGKTGDAVIGAGQMLLLLPVIQEIVRSGRAVTPQAIADAVTATSQEAPEALRPAAEAAALDELNIAMGRESIVPALRDAKAAGILPSADELAQLIATSGFADSPETLLANLRDVGVISAAEADAVRAALPRAFADVVEFNPIQLESMQELVQRPMTQTTRDKFISDWTAIDAEQEELNRLQRSASPERLQQMSAALDDARSSLSTTITAADPDAARALQNWQEAAGKVSGWAANHEALTEDKIRELNRTIGEGLPNQAPPSSGQIGAYRTGHDWVHAGVATRPYIDPSNVERAMATMMDWYRSNVGHMHPVELAGRMYQWMVSIHPFWNGNGRTARLVSDYILLSHGYPPAAIPPTSRSVAVFGRLHPDQLLPPLSTARATDSMTKGVQASQQIVRAYLAP